MAFYSLTPITCGVALVALLSLSVDCQVLCGTKPALRNAAFARIFSGQSAQYGEVPWQVNIYENERRNCGGTIIRRRWVLSAAHCVISNFINQNSKKVYRLVAGDHSVSNWDSKQQVRYASRIVMHPEFDFQTLRNDIVLLEADRPFEYNDYVVPACLPRSDETPYPFSMCTISGWGFVDPRTKPDLLQTAKIPILHQKQCYGLHHSAKAISAEFTPKMLCAGFLDGSKDSCQGDSGGPLTCGRYGGGSEQVLSGIVSWGRGCGEEHQPGVYTRVEPYMSWINATTAVLSSVNSDACKFSGVKIDDKNRGTIASPGFDEGEYPNDSTCSWEVDLSYVTAPDAKAVIEFDSFDLEEPPTQDNCRYDYAQIYVGENLDRLLGTYCGGQLPAALTVARQGVKKLIFKVVFHSDNTVTKRGFRLSYSAV